MKPRVLAADIGGTKISAALVNQDGEISQKRYTLTNAEQGLAATFERLTKTIESVLSESGRSYLLGMGVAVAGPMDLVTGTVYDPPNLPGWDGFIPKPILEQRFSLETVVANDATLGALGEHRYGAGRGHKHMIYMTLSTGIGGGMILNGSPYTGNRGFAGEIGHFSIDRNGPKCGCGSFGCLEVMASGNAVARIARERLLAGEHSRILDLVAGDPTKVDARLVVRGARLGDELSKSVLSEISTNLAIGLVGLINIFDPDVVVIGGGLSNGIDMMMPTITRELNLRSMGQHRGKMPVLKAQRGDDVCLVGAAALAFREFGV